jgi:hypothetical protein
MTAGKRSDLQFDETPMPSSAKKPKRKTGQISLHELKREDFNAMTREQLGSSLRKAAVPTKPEK